MEPFTWLNDYTSEKKRKMKLSLTEREKKCGIYLCEWVFFRLIAIEERQPDKRRMLSESDFVRVQNGADWRGSTGFPKCIINFVFSKLNFMKRIAIIFFLSCLLWWKKNWIIYFERGYDYYGMLTSPPSRFILPY